MLDSNEEPKVWVQLMRMTGLEFFPTEKAALRELVMALMCADTMAIIERVVNDWLAGSSSRPTPVDLRLAVNAENDRDGLSPAVKNFNNWKALNQSQRKRPGDPKLNELMDEHLHLLRLRMDEINKHGRKPTEVSTKLATLTEELRLNHGSGNWHRHSAPYWERE